ncbi:hypothetical protein [Sediminibacterium soli]|uniref:hypothetical protein n=1 Tax=Sediminibacterium soli TaxID=2698829 RepID=UPI001379C1A2|nr:hypothetical protein [Sediminibacterium soli]NCI47951.1 hypothetical protein [Sediminibacterium soli]
MHTTMKPIVLAILGGAALLLLFSCEEKKEDITYSVDKHGSIETSVQVQHLDSAHDVLITKHIVWTKNEPVKNIYYADTIPALGLENTVAENEDGETKQVTVKKDYQVFLTVK